MGKPICEHLSTDEVTDDKLHSWLEEQAKKYTLEYLLAHAEDGVIWGHFKSSKLTTSGSKDVFPEFAKLHLSTLQQCRIFSKDAEVMLWKIDQDLKARLITDDHLSKGDYISEDQILWGTQAEAEQNGFTLVSDGQQGLRHAVPLTTIPFNKANRSNRPLRLTVRHYIDYDELGVARIYLSRLVSLTAKEIKL